jgi:hypothetical protein
MEKLGRSFSVTSKKKLGQEALFHIHIVSSPAHIQEAI